MIVDEGEAWINYHIMQIKYGKLIAFIASLENNNNLKCPFLKNGICNADELRFLWVYVVNEQ